MIEINELRVGNIILLDTGFVLPSPHKVKAKDIYDISQGKITLNSLEGILLTPRILEATGFENVGFGNGPNSLKYQKDYVVLFFDKSEEAAFFCYYKDENKKKGRTIRTVHDLQNFYYSITGEEIFINLNQLQQA